MTWVTNCMPDRRFAPGDVLQIQRYWHGGKCNVYVRPRRWRPMKNALLGSSICFPSRPRRVVVNEGVDLIEGSVWRPLTLWNS